MHEIAIAKSFYDGLREAVEDNCTVTQIKQPQLYADDGADSRGFSVFRPRVDQVKVVMRMQGMWMVVVIEAIRESINSVMIIARKWCEAKFGDQLDSVPCFEEATSLA